MNGNTALLGTGLHLGGILINDFANSLGGELADLLGGCVQVLSDPFGAATNPQALMNKVSGPLIRHMTGHGQLAISEARTDPLAKHQSDTVFIGTEAGTTVSTLHLNNG
jgi:hypothetical protein